MILTGHNADDIAETVYMNILRGDFFRLAKCVEIVTGRDGPLPRAKPFKYTYEKEIVMYAHFKKLDYFSTKSELLFCTIDRLFLLSKSSGGREGDMI